MAEKSCLEANKAQILLHLVLLTATSRLYHNCLQTETEILFDATRQLLQRPDTQKGISPTHNNSNTSNNPQSFPELVHCLYALANEGNYKSSAAHPEFESKHLWQQPVVPSDGNIILYWFFYVISRTSLPKHGQELVITPITAKSPGAFKMYDIHSAQCFCTLLSTLSLFCCPR